MADAAVLEQLLKARADVNATNKAGATALLYAAAFADPDRHDAILGVLNLVPVAIRSLHTMDLR